MGGDSRNVQATPAHCAGHGTGFAAFMAGDEASWSVHERRAQGAPAWTAYGGRAAEAVGIVAADGWVPAGADSIRAECA